MKEVLLEAEHLTKEYTKRGKRFLAVNDVKLQIYKGETLALVGESGSGKSTLGKLLLRLEKPTSGALSFENLPYIDLSPREFFPYRRQMQMIFQDPYASLNPKMTLSELITEGLQIHRLLSEQNKESKTVELLEMVGLPADYRNRYPHECSGGERQRVGIARALALLPTLVVCDEPVSSLDAAIREQILFLMRELREKQGMTYLFITHDLSVARKIADRIAVMHQGKLVEIAPPDQLFSDPQHSYTKALLEALPKIPEKIASNCLKPY